MNGRNYVEYGLVLSPLAVLSLSALNEAGSPLKEESHDLKFIRMMVIALYTSAELSTKNFPPQKRNMMEKIFGVRVTDNDDRKNKFNDLFSIAMKEAIIRNSKKAEKLSKVQLPETIFERKMR